MSKLTEAFAGFRIPMPDGAVIPPDIDASTNAVLKGLAEVLRRLAEENAGYPVATEADGSRWVSLDWLLEKLPK